LDGFIVGLALTIAAGQLHKLFGIHVDADNFFADIGLLLRDIDQTVPATLAVGVASLALLFVLEELAPRIPAALVVTVLSIVSVSILSLESRGVEIIGEIPSSLPVPGLPSDLSWGDLGALLPGALGIAIVGFAESIAAARSYATKHRYKVDANQELVALGAANAGAGLFGGFTVDGSLSKSAAAEQAGQKTQMASLVLSAAVFVTILFLTGLFENLAEATLGAIVIHAVWRLIKFSKVGRYRVVRRTDFAAGLAAMVGVLLFDILAGLGIAVIVSILAVLARASRPRWAILGRIRTSRPGEPDDVVYQDTAAHPEAETTPGLLILRFDAGLFFANAPSFKQAVLDSIDVADSPVQVVLIDASAITDIDSTALAMLDELIVDLADRGIELWTARMRSVVAEITDRYGTIAEVHPDREYPTVRAAVDAFVNRPPSAPPGPDTSERNTP
jgi:MFS superfamily sulfate permease-like transporter